MAIFTESTCIDWEVCPPLRCMNEAKYSFLPKFSQEPAMKKYMKDISDAEMLLTLKVLKQRLAFRKVLKLFSDFLIFFGILDLF